MPEKCNVGNVKTYGTARQAIHEDIMLRRKDAL